MHENTRYKVIDQSSIDAISSVMNEEGWAIVPDMVPGCFLDQLNRDLEAAYETCRRVQRKNGVDVNTDGTVHHLLGQAPSFLQLFEVAAIHPFVDRFFEAKYILNSYCGVINLPHKPSYVCKVHRDIRTFSGPTQTMLNLLVMLDDFTPENGATYILPRGHKSGERPTDDQFYTQAIRAVGTAGSLLFFNSNLWHAAGENRTAANRRALTISFTRPYMKQQMDYPRVLGNEVCESLSEELKQLVGYNARVPASLDEWYQPPAKRCYKPGQG
jgi:ectoine hydroxylase-related dioxygenase (phytanoyl-CoA dioxygenase family)